MTGGASLPCSMDSSRRSRMKYCRIFVRARGLATKFSQSRLGPALGDFEVSTSTWSPLFSWYSNGTSRWFTRAPIVRWPTSVCTE